MMLFYERQLIEGVTVFSDEKNASDPAHPIYYLLPEQPRFRLDEIGRPVFRFIKYRVPIERADGKKGGGFVIFDVEFVVPADKLAKVKAALEAQLPPPDPRAPEPPRVELASIAYTKGTASVLLFQESGGSLIEKVHSPGKPSLYGNNVCSVTVELTDIGAAIAEQALQGKGGVVQVRYDLTCAVKLPDVKIDGHFHASQFYSFYQTIDTDWNLWSEDSYRETLREQLIQSEAMSLTVDGGPIGAANPDLLAELKSWAQKALEDAIERNMITAATPVGADDRKLPDGIEDVTRDIRNTKISDVSLRVREKAVIEWSPAPQGTLPNITSLIDTAGNPILWTDFATTVSADDPFFQAVRVRASVNADFKALKLHSVDVALEYDSPDGLKTGGGKVTSPDQVVALDAYRGAHNRYRYSYKVNYLGESRAIDLGPLEDTAPFLTINVGDLGFLAVDVQPGDVNFDQVASVFVSMSYEDGAAVALLEDEFTLTKATPSHRAFDRVIFAPVKQPYRYHVTYRMTDGKELTTGELTGRAPRLFINDPFSATATVNLRTWGNLDDHVKEIIVELDYLDDANGYRRTYTSTLSKTHPFDTWEFPVVREAGTTLSYAVLYTFHDGRPPVEVPRAVTGERTLLLGLEPPDKVKLNVEVLADLIDFTKVKLAKVSLQYDDPDNDVHETASAVFRAGAPTSWKWATDLKDKTRKAYTWSATFYLTDGTHRDVASTTTSDGTVVLEVPAA